MRTFHRTHVSYGACFAASLLASLLRIVPIKLHLILHFGAVSRNTFATHGEYDISTEVGNVIITYKNPLTENMDCEKVINLHFKL